MYYFLWPIFTAISYFLLKYSVRDYELSFRRNKWLSVDRAVCLVLSVFGWFIIIPLCLIVILCRKIDWEKEVKW